MPANDLATQLNRIEGQVRGIRKMVEDDRGCMEVLQQIVAIRASLMSVGVKMIKHDMHACVDQKNPAAIDELIDKLFKLG